MSLIEAELRKALEPSVRRKANTTRNFRAIASRLTARNAASSSEVMVKITGFGKGGSHVRSHLDYIARNGKLELENDRGEVFDTQAKVREYFKDWEADLGNTKRHKNQRDTMHLVLSMPETTDPEAVRGAARAFAKELYGHNHEYVMALHHPGNDKDSKQPHVHLSVKCLGFDETRLNPGRADLQHWRETFAEKLRDIGVDATATPRKSRGIVKKAERSVIQHIVTGDKTHPPRTSIAKQGREAEAARDLSHEIQGVPVTPKPWERAIAVKQREIRNAWLAAARELDRHGNTTQGHLVQFEERQDLALRIKSFVMAMPLVETENQQIKAELVHRFTKSPGVSLGSAPQARNQSREGSSKNSDPPNVPDGKGDLER